jgi:GNAT superfamily N-acetyltransferase
MRAETRPAVVSAPQGEPGWTVRPYQPGDEPALVDLFQRAYRRTISEAHFRWKLKALPAPAENVWLAVTDGGVIAQYASIPVRYRLPDREAVLMVGADVMTAPEYRRRGLFTALARVAYDAWRRAGVPFTLGLPNEQWGSRKAALGWTVLFSLQSLVRPLRPERILARRLRAPVVGRLRWPGELWNRWLDRRSAAAIEVRPVSAAGPEFDRLWAAHGDAFRISPVRDAAWVRWRYLTAPAFDYRVLLAERAGRAIGYAALRLDESGAARVGTIAEIFADPSDETACRALLRRCVDALRSADVEQVVALAIPGTPHWRACRAAGFLPRHAFTVEVSVFDAAVPMDVLRDPSHWSLAGGDFDVV